MLPCTSAETRARKCSWPVSASDRDSDPDLTGASRVRVEGDSELCRLARWRPGCVHLGLLKVTCVHAQGACCGHDGPGRTGRPGAGSSLMRLHARLRVASSTVEMSTDTARRGRGHLAREGAGKRWFFLSGVASGLTRGVPAVASTRLISEVPLARY